MATLDMDTTCFREWTRMMAGESKELIGDGMIATTARVHGLDLATRNEKGFRDFHGRTFNPFQWGE